MTWKTCQCLGPEGRGPVLVVDVGADEVETLEERPRSRLRQRGDVATTGPGVAVADEVDREPTAGTEDAPDHPSDRPWPPGTG